MPRLGNVQIRRRRGLGKAAIGAVTGIIVLALAAGGSLLPASGAPAAPPGPARGGTLRVGITGDWSTLDPAHYTNVSEREIFYSIYNPLFSLDPSFAIRPGLVKSWTISADGLHLTFHLQTEVRFHDGTPFDAAAVKFNIDRMLNPATGSAFRTILAPIKDVRVVDPATVELTLSGPFTPLLAWFTEGPGFVASPDAIRKWGDQYGLHPAGTGPFEFVEWVKNDHIALRRFQSYWERGLPYLDGIVYRPTNDETVKMAGLRAGSLDIVDTVPAREQRAVRADPRFKNIPLAGSRWPMIRLNTAIPPFNSKALRQAVSYWVNRQQIVTAIYFGQARPAYGPISPVYREYYDPSASRYGYHDDLAQAKAALAVGGRPGGFSFTLEISTSPEQTRLAELIKAQLAEAGINANIQAYDLTTLQDRITGKRYQAVIGSWTPRPDIDGTMYNHFSTHGNVNSVSYSNATVDALLEQTRVIPAGSERIRLYRQIQRQVVDDAPWVFLVFENLMIGMQQRVEGLPAIPDAMMRFKAVWLQH
jgi:peptide/nickel transport system substrate-binding protein